MSYQTPIKVSSSPSTNQSVAPWQVKIDRVTRLTASDSGLQSDVIQLPANQSINQSISVHQKLMIEILDPSIGQSVSAVNQTPTKSTNQPTSQSVNHSKWAVVKAYHHPSLTANTCRFQVCVNQSINQSINQSVYDSNPLNLISAGQSVRIHRLPVILPIAQSIKLSIDKSVNLSVNIQSYVNQSINQSIVFVGQHLVVSLMDRYFALTVESIESPQSNKKPVNQSVNQSTNQSVSQSTSQSTDHPINQSPNQSTAQIHPVVYFADNPRITIVKSSHSINQSVNQSVNQPAQPQFNQDTSDISDNSSASLSQPTLSPNNQSTTIPTSETSTDLVTKQSINQSIEKPSVIDFSMIGGLEKELESIRQMIELPLLRPEVFSQFGVRPPRGLLLYGPPGCGKTLIARSIHQSINQSSNQSISFFHLNGSEIHSAYVGESEERLRAVFNQAINQSPSILFIDEIDSLCPSRDRSIDQLSKRLVSTLLTAMDGVRSVDRLIVIGATNRPDSIDAAMRRPGRFDREIEIAIPSINQRVDILQKLLKSIPNDLSVNQIDWLASQCHGFVGADLKALCREAATHVIQSIHQSINQSTNDQSIDQPVSQIRPTSAEQLNSQSDDHSTLPDISSLSISQSSDQPTTHQHSSTNQSTNPSVHLTFSDLKYALTRITPSSMRGHFADVPRVNWSDIGGQQSIKQRLQESINWPLTHAHVFTRLRISPPRGILLYGPPGCSKTLMAKALASESSRNYLSVKGPELLSKWVGDSEKAVSALFRRARAAAPCILFFDEIDSIAATRSSGENGEADRVSERVLSQLLQELDGFNDRCGVFVLAATNRPDRCDAALLRPGRIDRILYVEPPQRKDECEILDIELTRMEHDPDVNGVTIMEQYDIYCQKRASDSLSSQSINQSFTFASSQSNNQSNNQSINQSNNLHIGYTGAELAALCREAALSAIEQDRHAHKVSMTHFIAAFQRVQPRLTKQQIEFYQNYAANSGLTSI